MTKCSPTDGTRWWIPTDAVRDVIRAPRYLALLGVGALGLLGAACTDGGDPVAAFTPIRDGTNTDRPAARRPVTRPS